MSDLNAVVAHLEQSKGDRAEALIGFGHDRYGSQPLPDDRDPDSDGV